MKLLRMRLANWLTQGGYLAACKAATEYEVRYQEMSRKAVTLEQTVIIADNQTRAACKRAGSVEDRINKLSDDNHRMSEGLDQIIRYGEGKIGPTGNGSLRRAVRMAESALYPSGADEALVVPENPSSQIVMTLEPSR